ncbi:DHH family phosphoesterase [Photobacterium alginatilyticum]|uniref:DHH family phosphoesterase n=1 Tax=Photobacterium alginatilyticum TaxID=1775171 RepID=A0ABW9YCX7_9GAMM|nr:DHH family phosphoesterase [Photobacterium alginatilyticum]NBI51605.1 DHH family phosphoesterase [Photobacterium alginatilyticum]
MHYDVFNGDADGIIALLQLRWVEPRESTLVTGVKRDIKLLKQVPQSATSVTVLDLSMEKNAEPLASLLSSDTSVFYCDHHRSGIIPQHDNCEVLIDVSPEICTSLLINQYLGDKYIYWAIAAAFGDNLHSVAYAMAEVNGLDEEQTAFLCELGTLINYNGYGSCLDDLHIAPADLYHQLQPYQNPFELLNNPESPYFHLKAGYENDYKHVNDLQPYVDTVFSTVFMLPAAVWARRVSGVFGNELANQNPNKAHAVLTMNPSNTDYTVSVRAPLSNRTGADEICCQFPTGGGRKAAAGINALPVEQLDVFVETLNHFYQ